MFSCPFRPRRICSDIVLPSIIVENLEKDSDNCEVVRHYSPEEYYKENPLGREEVSLKMLIDAGVPIKEIDPRIYESRNEGDLPSQSELNEVAENYVNSQTIENNE